LEADHPAVGEAEVVEEDRQEGVVVAEEVVAAGTSRLKS
jgi:hypothetical protein